MNMRHTVEETIIKLEEALGSPADFYKEGFLNWSGRAIDGDEYYSELLAERLLEHNTLDTLLDGIPMIERQTSYCTPRHQVGSGRGQVSSRREEILAKSITTFPFLGRVRDYQVPLKDKMSDQGVGKIDLVVEGDDALWLVELKYLNKSETLLRCALEISTYFRRVNKQKLRADFGVSHDLPVRKAVVFDRNSLAFDEFEEMDQGGRRQLRSLLRRLEVRILHFEWIDVKMCDP